MQSTLPREVSNSAHAKFALNSKMPNSAVDQAQNAKFHPAINHLKKICILGITFFTILNLVSLVLSAVAYSQSDKKESKELAQCIVLGIFFFLIATSTWLIITLKPNRQTQSRLIFSGATIIFDGLVSLGFGVVFTKVLIRNEGWEGEVTVRTASTIINLVCALVAFVLLFFHRPLFAGIPRDTDLGRY
ncbi:hypothetical protein NM208_g1013 [Fusarium decemcellulare]|uniref:Uncharacterized protein n=1 Tax=Fusarium decemcellulare TaxID=57161 RepID=A0ACC1SXI3_9HYPO|nr:hypothetical protein NM208_g1013 [Fusarium decemcellulare]